MANCYNCGGAVRCAGRSGTGVQAEGRVCNLCGDNGGCQRRTNGQMREARPVLARRLSLLAATMLAGLATPALAQIVPVSNQAELDAAIDQANGGANITLDTRFDLFDETIAVSGSLRTLNAGSLTIGGGPNGRNIFISGGSFTFNRPVTILSVLDDFSTNLSGTGALTIGRADTQSIVVLSGANSYSGGTTIVGGANASGPDNVGRTYYYNVNRAIFANAGALPASGPITLRDNGTIGLNFALTQSVLNRIAPDSVGTVATGENVTTSANLDFSNLPNVSLGAMNYGAPGSLAEASIVTGTITPANATFRIGGGDGFLIIDSVLANQGASPARLVITGGNTRLRAVNTYTGGTLIQHGQLIIDSPSAIGPGGTNIQIDAGADLLLGSSESQGFSLNQVFLDRITTNSAGSVSLRAGGNANPLDFTNHPGLSLGGTRISGGTTDIVSTYTGALTPGGGTYRLGGNGWIQVGSILSGSNALAVTGGVVTLFNDHTFTGPTTISERAELIIGGAINGSINNTSRIENSGLLSLQLLAPAVFDRPIIGSGSFRQAGALVTLTTAQTYTGTTFVQSSLKIGPGGSIASSSIVEISNLFGPTDLDLTTAGSQTIRNLGGNGSVSLASGNTLTILTGYEAGISGFFPNHFSGTIRGTGNLVIDGPESIIFLGTNTYSGTTRIKSGTLTAGAANVLPAASPVTIDAGAVFDLGGFNQAIGTLNGAGRITNLGSGLAVLTVGSINDTTTFSGTIAQGLFGQTGLTKVGTGTLTLSGANTYTGATTVSAGTLNVSGSTARSSLTSVASGATLSGNGTVGSTTILSGGTLLPGGSASAGTLTINGNLTLNAGSNLRVDIGANQATTDRIVVTGTASLAGGLTAIANGGTFSSGSYTLLTANGGISGTFAPFVTQGTPPNGASVALRYDPNNVFLDVQGGGIITSTTSIRESLAFNAPTVTTNRVTNYSTRIIGRLLGGSPLYDQTFGAAFADPVVQAGITAARATITAAGGPGVIIGDPVRTASSTTSVTTTGAPTFTLANTQTTVEPGVVTFGPATLEVGTVVTCNVASLPSSTRPTCVNGATTLALGTNDTNINVNTNIVYTIDETRTDTITDTLAETWELNGQVVAVGSVHAEVQSGLFDLSARLLQRLTGPMAPNAGWAEGYAFRVAQSGTRRARGFAGGANLALGGGFSFAFGVDRGTLDIDLPGALESAGVELTEGGVALRYAGERFTAALSTTYGGGTAKTLRTIIGRSEARYGVKLAGIALDLGYGFKTGGWQLRPVAGIEYLSLRTNGFTESDTLGLVVREQRHSRTRASAGLEVARTWGRVQLAGSARYQTVLSGETRVVPVAFALAPARSLTMTGASEPDTALLNARLSVPVSSAAAVSFGYDGRFGTGYTTHSGVIGVSVAF